MCSKTPEKRLGSSAKRRIGTEHVLLALLGDNDGIASQALRAFADPAEIEARVHALMFPGPPIRLRNASDAVGLAGHS